MLCIFTTIKKPKKKPQQAVAHITMLYRDKEVSIKRVVAFGEQDLEGKRRGGNLFLIMNSVELFDYVQFMHNFA